VLRPNPKRRTCLKGAAVAGGSVRLEAGSPGRIRSPSFAGLHVASNQCVWEVFYKRENRALNSQTLDGALAEAAASGVHGFEPVVAAVEQLDGYRPLLRKHGLEMRSLYVDSSLHERRQAEKSIGEILAIAKRAKRLGARIVVTNPNPLSAGDGEGKTDVQLQTQAAALNLLGADLKAMGLMLAYHNHAVEMRHGAREFHHMMLATDSAHVTLCLDAHWIYRGAGNSAVALFDIVKLYGRRVSEIHLRQSTRNVCTESLGDGDLDYSALARYMAGIGVKPHLVLEQIPGADTPKTIDAVESHRRSRQYVDRVFAAFAASPVASRTRPDGPP
jgi:inosose dehydratase